jgi:hypothetical protein
VGDIRRFDHHLTEVIFPEPATSQLDFVDAFSSSYANDLELMLSWWLHLRRPLVFSESNLSPHCVRFYIIASFEGLQSTDQVSHSQEDHLYIILFI